MINWRIEEKRFELIYNWKLSRNETIEKNNLFILAEKGENFARGEVAPNIRYGETPARIKEEFDKFKDCLPTSLVALSYLDAILNDLKISNALRFGIESAFVHLLSKEKKLQVSGILGIPAPGVSGTCYTIPVMEPGQLRDFILSNDLKRFESLKVKINNISAYETLETIHGITNQPLKIDANEAWTSPDTFLIFCEKIKKYNIQFIEQPFPSSFIQEYRYLKTKSPFPVMADESVTNHPVWEEIIPQFHGVNVKLMKAGGYLNALRILYEAKARGLLTMIGCMVESTLGIFAAMQLSALADYCDLDGFMLIKNEPFGLVKEDQGELSISSMGKL